MVAMVRGYQINPMILCQRWVVWVCIYIPGTSDNQKGAQNEMTLDVDIYPCLLSCLVICVSMCDWKGCIMYASKCVYPAYLQCSHLLYIYFLPVLLFLSHIFSRHHPPFPSLAHNETIFKALAVFPSLFFLSSLSVLYLFLVHIAFSFLFFITSYLLYIHNTKQHDIYHFSSFSPRCKCL